MYQWHHIHIPRRIKYVVYINQWMSNCSDLRNLSYEQEHGPLQMFSPANAVCNEHCMLFLQRRPTESVCATRLLFYIKCIGFTVCLKYSEILLSLSINQSKINIEFLPCHSIIWNSKWRTKNPSKLLKKPLLRQKDDNIPQVRSFNVYLRLIYIQTRYIPAHKLSKR